MSDLLSVDDALARVLDACAPLGEERVPLGQALGRVLAAPVAADLDDPPFDRSAMDGFAITAQDASVPAVLQVVGTVAAGDPPPERPIAAGEALRIMTGAPTPPGCDRVVMVEHTEPAGQAVRVLKVPGPGGNIRRRAEVAARGDVVAEAGRLVTPELVGVLAAFGAATVQVHRRPRVVVMATGDELVPVDQLPGPGCIRDSNRWTIAALAQAAGAEVEVADTLRDTRESVLEGVRRGLAHDVLVLSGGVSMGVFDIVGDCLRELGAEIVFHKVAIQPGKPLLFARAGRTLVFGLPGNPVSVLVTGRVFLMPALRRLRGLARVTDPLLPARLVGVVGKAGDRTAFQPAVVTFASDGPVVRPIATLGSADQVAHARRNCFIVRPRGGGPYADGDTVACLVDPGSLHDAGG